MTGGGPPYPQQPYPQQPYPPAHQGYARPQGPWSAYPGPPPPPGQPPFQPPGRRLRPWWLLVVALVLVLAVGGVVTVFAVTRDDGPATEGPVPHLPVAWKVEADRSDYPEDYIGWDKIAKYSHVHDGDLIRLGDAAVARIDPVSGEIVWETPVPEHDQVCMVNLGGGSIAAMTYSVRPKECNRLAVFDLDTGEMVRNTKFSLRDFGDAAMYVQQDAVYLGRPSQQIWDVPRDFTAAVLRTDGRTGEEVWNTPLPDCFAVEDLRASATQLLVTTRCEGEEVRMGGYWRVWALDPDTGEQRWVTTVEADDEAQPAILSAGPPVIAHVDIDNACCFRQWYEVFDDTGGRRLEVRRGNDGSELAAGFRRHWISRFDSSAFAIVGDTMIAGDWADASEEISDRQLIGIDLDTGEQRWRTNLPAGASPEFVRPTTGDRLHVLNKVGPELYRLDRPPGGPSRSPAWRTSSPAESRPRASSCR
ncbi:outer membrane protein assembly factor BamB family protein [Qaidamihabitans albus]|uniref:outer membrane protein assembly factor BamB family protein n=1 Tax=Qaidamihabitans albus TaxID=2795733 RepID=UPI0018F13A4F|nr:PQQ-binding-like beta-propeller repeat protein [Qaidamihabitans albus]